MQNAKKIVTLLTLILLFTTACNDALEPKAPDAPSGEVGKVVKSGKFEERVELQEVSINNCKDQDETVYVAERSRSLEESVDIVMTGGLSGGVNVGVCELGAAVGAEYGVGRGLSVTDGGSLELKAGPNTFPVFTIAWTEKWEEGYMVVRRDGQEEQVPYLYLSSARTEKRETRYIDCDGDEASLEAATAEKAATDTLLPPANTPPPTNAPPSAVPSGKFTMGSDDGSSDEKPVHTVYLDTLYIDKYEATNAQYAAFLNERGNQSEGGATWLGAGDDDARIRQSGGVGKSSAGDGWADLSLGQRCSYSIIVEFL